MNTQTHDIKDANKYINKDKVSTIITFRTQQLYDLWVNEFSGQISDGMWENSRGTDWLWKNVWVRLGNETKVEVRSIHYIRRRRFGMVKELWDCVGDRIIKENGFSGEKEARAAWREIATAIYNAKETKEAREFCDKLKAEKENFISSQKDGMYQEWIDVCKPEGKSLENLKRYGYLSYSFNKREVVGSDGITRTHSSFFFLELRATTEGVLRHVLKYNDSSWFIPAGKLAEAIKALEEFDAKMIQLRSNL